MTRLITVTSGKGGVGKTTTSINLAAAMNAFGKEVVIVDANLTTPNVGLHLGAPIVPISLNHLLLGKADISEAIYEHESGMKVIPSSLSVNELRRINHKKLNDVGRKLRKMADVVIYDSAAGLGEEAVASMVSADDIVLVTNAEIPAVTDALKASKLIEQLGKPITGVIVTKFKGSKHEMKLSNISEMLELPILGVIPEDEKVSAALVAKDALVHVYPYSKSARAYKRVAAKLIGHDYREEAGFFGRLFGR